MRRKLAHFCHSRGGVCGSGGVGSPVRSPRVTLAPSPARELLHEHSSRKGDQRALGSAHGPISPCRNQLLVATGCRVGSERRRQPGPWAVQAKADLAPVSARARARLPGATSSACAHNQAVDEDAGTRHTSVTNGEAHRSPS